MMHWLELTPKEKVVKSDNDFLAKVPVLPYRWLYEKKGHVLAVHKPTEEGAPYYLQTDHDEFYSSFKKYYEERFEVNEKDQGFNLSGGYTILIGQASGSSASSETASNAETEEEQFQKQEKE